MAVELKQIEVARNQTRALTAQISESGDFVFAGHEDIQARDLGDAEDRYAGATDYELTVPASYKDTMLLWLIRDRFDSEADLEAWLEERGIPSAFHNSN